MNKCLYVGNLPYSITRDEVRQAFEECGDVVRVNIVTDRETGKSKGFGFVEMGTESEATAAITHWNGSTLGERCIVVDEAKERKQFQRPRRDGRRDGQRSFNR